MSDRDEITDPNAAHDFIDGIDLPRMTPATKERLAAETGGAPPVYRDGESQVIAIGSQIAEFTADVPAALRPQIANAFLLAQLAANRAVETTGAGGSAWYRAYVEVLANTGWILERDESSEREMSGTSNEVHKEIIPLLTLLLGPGVAAAAMVTAVLEGLSNMDRDSLGSPSSTERAGGPRATSFRSATLLPRTVRLRGSASSASNSRPLRP